MQNSPQSETELGWNDQLKGWSVPVTLGSQFPYSQGGSVRKRIENYNHEEIPKTTEAVTALHEDEEPLEWPCLDPIVYGGYRVSEERYQN